MTEITALTPAAMEPLYDRFRSVATMRAGDVVYMSGALGVDDALQPLEGREAQYTRAFENQERLLDAVGATWDDVVTLNSYHTDMRDIPLMFEVKDRFITRNYPTWTAVAVPFLRLPGQIIELRCFVDFGQPKEYLVPPGQESHLESFHYTPVIRIGDKVYMTGQVGVTDDLTLIEGRAAQDVQMYENIQRLLAVAGATFDDVVQRESFHLDTREGWFPTRFGDGPPVDLLSINDRYFTNPSYPAWTGVGVRALGPPDMPHMMEEMQCFAIRNRPRQFITPPGHENHVENFHYTPVVKVDDTLYMTGQVGIDAGLRSVDGREAHTVQAFDNQQKLLDAAGAGWDRVVEIVSYHTDLRDLDLFFAVAERYLGDHRPTFTPLGTTALGTIDMPQTMLEIKCEAVV